MSTIISGIVRDGLVVPNTPLPEGARVEIFVAEAQVEVPDALQAEFDAWDRSSAEALALVEGLAIEGESDEAR
jgi:hypothetical protein